MDSTTISHLSKGSISSSIGDSWELEGTLPLSDRLKAFKTSQFDPDSYITHKCHTMSEKVREPQPLSLSLSMPLLIV